MVSRRTAGLLMLAAVVFMGWMATPQTPWVWGPVVGAVSDTYGVISWTSARPLSVDLQYGPATFHDTSGAWEETLTFDRQDGRAEIWLRDLQPGTTYRFQLIGYEGDAVFPSEVGTLRTTEAGQRDLTILAYGHSRSHPDRHRLVADSMVTQVPEATYALHLGDLVESFDAERMANLFWAIEALGRSMSYLTVAPETALDLSLYYETFALPRGGGTSSEQWWSLEVGNLLLIALDSTLDDPLDARAQQQVAWLEETLRLSSAPVIAVACANPLYSTSFADGRNEALIDLWESLLVDGGVDVLLSSFPGGYEHGYVRGIHYVNTGGGGGPANAPKTDRCPGLVFRREGILHFLRLTLADDRLRVEAVPVASVRGDDVFRTPSSAPIDAFVVEPD